MYCTYFFFKRPKGEERGGGLPGGVAGLGKVCIRGSLYMYVHTKLPTLLCLLRLTRRCSRPSIGAASRLEFVARRIIHNTSSIK